MSRRIICKECNRDRRAYARGLCQQCHMRPEIRAKYESDLSRQRRGLNPLDRLTREPTPTTAPPGSEEKILVLIRRMENGEKLFSEDDEQTLSRKPTAYKREPRTGTVQNIRSEVWADILTDYESE